MGEIYLRHKDEVAKGWTPRGTVEFGLLTAGAAAMTSHEWNWVTQIPKAVNEAGGGEHFIHNIISPFSGYIGAWFWSSTFGVLMLVWLYHFSCLGKTRSLCATHCCATNPDLA